LLGGELLDECLQIGVDLIANHTHRGQVFARAAVTVRPIYSPARAVEVANYRCFFISQRLEEFRVGGGQSLDRLERDLTTLSGQGDAISTYVPGEAWRKVYLFNSSERSDCDAVIQSTLAASDNIRRRY
jgi:hypothetical protein